MVWNKVLNAICLFEEFSKRDSCRPRYLPLVEFLRRRDLSRIRGLLKIFDSAQEDRKQRDQRLRSHTVSRDATK